MPYPTFDRSRLKIQPLANRIHDLNLNCLVPLEHVPSIPPDPAMALLADRLVAARDRGASRIWMLGAHVLRAGVVRHLIDLMDMGLVSGIALNGAGPIHDWEFALIGVLS